MGMPDSKFFEPFQQCFRSLSSLFGAFCRTTGSLRTRGSPLSSFCSIILFLNFLTLLPTGNRIGCNLRVIRYSLLIKGFHICLVCFPVKPGYFLVGFQLMTVSDITDSPCSAFRKFFALMRRLYTHVVILVFRNFMVYTASKRTGHRMGSSAADTADRRYYIHC